jgi:hypothetical protein
MLNHNTATNAMLIEQCRPGGTLDTRAPSEADIAAADLLLQLRSAACPTLLPILAAHDEDVLLHGDFHHHNILAAQRREWQAIDPLPAVGDAAYDAVQYLLFRKGDLAVPQIEWGAVIDKLCSLLEVDPERVKAWVFVRLITDALAALERGIPVQELDAEYGDLWTARLIQRLRH